MALRTRRIVTSQAGHLPYFSPFFSASSGFSRIGFPFISKMASSITVQLHPRTSKLASTRVSLFIVTGFYHRAVFLRAYFLKFSTKVPSEDCGETRRTQQFLTKSGTLQAHQPIPEHKIQGVLGLTDRQSLPSQEFTRRRKWRREWDSILALNPKPLITDFK